ncbi:NLR family CARD domain-containing protein 3-like [Hoplias malabaricus]|uniref:NLR family CARD domain-containing protein 3-like n=1 Tax=Hoplias malabaricus TaxID=27720 RepID=UPI003462E655
MKSDWSKDVPLRFRETDSSPGVRFQTEKSGVYSKTKLKSIFKDLECILVSLLRKELERCVNVLSSDYPACSEREEGDEFREGVMKITLKLLRNMKHTLLADTLQRKLNSVHQKHLKSILMEKSRRINEGLSQQGTSSLLNEIYTDLYITEGGSGEVSKEHEVRQIETVCRRPAAQEKPIKCSELFKDKDIRTVLTKGVAGIGKTVSVQKFILDWAEGKENQDVLFIFPLPFRELNLMKEKRLSLMQLLHQFFSKIKELKLIDCDSSKVLFIFDGLDECRLPLDFQNNKGLWDVTQSASVDVLLTNLIKGNLLPSASLWITSRPAAANQIPPECVDQVTEVRGFSDPQKEEYFRKRISDQSLANQIISHIKSSRSLYIMCHIPVFCWISAMVLEGVLSGAEGGETPKTLTQMFTHFLIFQIKHKAQKYQVKQEVDLQKTRESVLALGKLAFQQLEKGNLIFYEDELRECGIDVREVSVYSGVCTQIFREECGLHLGKVFSFVHLSVQEFLAALYAFLSFTSRDEPEQSSTDLSGIFRASTMSKFLKSAVYKALQSENGHLDLFLRFLLGLSLESNQTLLRGILTQTGIRSHSTEETVQYIKEKIRENPSPETSINLFHCLNELSDHSLVQEVQKYLKRGRRRFDGSLTGVRLSSAHWSALVFVLLNSEDVLEEFNLNKYHPSHECLLKLLPVVKASRKAVLYKCNLTTKSCAALASALSSNSSSLRELNLSGNILEDLGVKLLCTGLENPLCKLEKLGLAGCRITDEGCAALASALKSNPFHLRELNLDANTPGKLGKNLLSDLQKDPLFKLQILR